MEANRTDSERCLSIAKNEALNGNYEKAIKFVEKSIKLYPSEYAKNLLNEYKEKLNLSEQTKSNSASTDNLNSNNKTNNTNQKHETNSDSNNHQHKEYSADQLDAVKKIKNCRDFYEILGVPKTSSDEDLKKAYKKLALKFHPDKNKAPGATDAFKAIGKAFAILSDAQKRKQYDQLGPESFEDSSPSMHTTRNRYRSNSNYNTYYWNEDDFSADELFNLFFGSGAGFNSASARSRNHPHSRNHAHTSQSNYVFTSSNNYAVLFQLMPILLIVLLSLLSNLMISEPMFSLQRNSKYSMRRTTNEHKVPYFVRNDFKIESAGELAKLERQVEEELRMELSHTCFREKSYKDTAIWRARNYGDERVLKKAMEYETPSCDKIKQIFGGA